MDRNVLRRITITVDEVALRKESVDRNNAHCSQRFDRFASLSARRAWIEMGYVRGVFVLRRVALRKESVDRNKIIKIHKILNFPSLSARRAWIEIIMLKRFCAISFKSLSARRAWIEIQTAAIDRWGKNVALRKESVDRNNNLQ